MSDSGDLDDVYSVLTDIRDHLFSLRSDLAPVITYFANVTEAARRESELPLDLPGREAFVEAGITTVSQIPKTIRRIEEIVGDDAMCVVQWRLNNG